MFDYRVALHHIFSSPEHNYFTRKKFEVGSAPLYDLESVSLNAGKGIAGDRFCHSRYPITFFSLEVAEELFTALGQPLSPELFRRNIIISGINLNELIGERFSIGGVGFEGVSHCAPCTWMNAVIGEGAYKLMRGRGGLRANVVAGGELILGDQMLQCSKALERNPAEAIRKRPLP